MVDSFRNDFSWYMSKWCWDISASVGAVQDVACINASAIRNASLIFDSPDGRKTSATTRVVTPAACCPCAVRLGYDALSGFFSASRSRDKECDKERNQALCGIAGRIRKKGDNDRQSESKHHRK